MTVDIYASGETLDVEIDGCMAVGAPTTLPVVLRPPYLIGTAQVDLTLTCSPGVWANSPTLSLVWLRNGVPIDPTATDPSYTLLDADGGQTVSCLIIATNDGGQSLVTASIGIGPIAKVGELDFSDPDQSVFLTT